MITLLAMIGLATAGGPLESAQMDGTAHAPRQGDIFLKPFGTSSQLLCSEQHIETCRAYSWLSH